MKHEDKLEWMKEWAQSHGVTLVVEGECGFGRECVGIAINELYPDYEWYAEDYERADSNGDVWTPYDAYHKHPCVAVLGRGEEAEDQLYEWLKWFDANGFGVETGDKPLDPNLDPLSRMIRMELGGDHYARMVRKQK